MILRDALLQGTQLLEGANVEAPRLTAEVLLAHATGHDRTWLYAHSTDELREVWWIHYGRYLHERMQGKPTQYITGHQEFFGRDFRVTSDVLIPRPETEHVIEAALARAGGAAIILDIGTGSGAIAVTLALETQARVVGTDLSTAAIAIAQENAQRLRARVDFLACDLANSLQNACIELVVSNPPYVPLADEPTLQREVRDHEPALALYAGIDGLDIYRRLIPEAARVLKPGGWLVLELGYNSANAVHDLLHDWRDVAVLDDLAGIPRVMCARRPS